MHLKNVLWKWTSLSVAFPKYWSPGQDPKLLKFQCNTRKNPHGDKLWFGYNLKETSGDIWNTFFLFKLAEWHPFWRMNMHFCWKRSHLRVLKICNFYTFCECMKYQLSSNFCILPFVLYSDVIVFKMRER